jgi:hypothetical protein
MRKTPRTRLMFRVIALTARESAALEALLVAYQAKLYGVPFWPDAQVLSGNVGIGATSVPVSTPLTKFVPGALMMIWRDMFTFELLTILSVTSTTVTLSAGATKSWTADNQTFVVPVLSGRLQAALPVQHETSEIMDFDVDFKCEVV